MAGHTACYFPAYCTARYKAGHTADPDVAHMVDHMAGHFSAGYMALCMADHIQADHIAVDRTADHKAVGHKVEQLVVVRTVGRIADHKADRTAGHTDTECNKPADRTVDHKYFDHRTEFAGHNIALADRNIESFAGHRTAVVAERSADFAPEADSATEPEPDSAAAPDSELAV